MLWSIAAGPLVNVLLVPVFEGVFLLARARGWMHEAPNAFLLIWYIRWINIALLIFNLLPIYPLDGGQLLRALLWFPLGRIRSLQVACAIGLVGGAGLAVFGYTKSWWLLVIMAFFLLSQAFAGWQQARALAAEEREAKQIQQDLRERPVL